MSNVYSNAPDTAMTRARPKWPSFHGCGKVIDIDRRMVVGERGALAAKSESSKCTVTICRLAEVITARACSDAPGEV